MLIHFNSTRFINVRLTQQALSVWPVAQPVVRQMDGDADSFANLATSHTPLATFFFFQKAPSGLPKPYLVSETHWYCRTSARSLFPAVHTPRSLSASALLNSTAIVFILCVAYLILSDNGWIINQDFCAD